MAVSLDCVVFVITFRTHQLMITGTALYGLLLNTTGTWGSCGQERCAHSVLFAVCCVCVHLITRSITVHFK